MTGCLHPGGQNLTNLLLEWAELPTGARILDLGCGDGQTVSHLLHQGFDAVGIDLEEPILEQTVQGNMCALPFCPQSFDAVMAECSISACGDAKKALQEAHRVLKPQGKLLLSDVFFPKTDGARAEALTSLVEQSGFLILRQEDVSQLAQEFFLRLIWETGELPREWRCVAAGRRAGYFTLYGRKL